MGPSKAFINRQKCESSRAKYVKRFHFLHHGLPGLQNKNSDQGKAVDHQNGGNNDCVDQASKTSGFLEDQTTAQREMDP
jgi:hypothetical protein